MTASRPLQGARAGGFADLAAESLARSGRFRFRASGASMLPLFRPGDELEFIVPTDPVKPGDVVLWTSGDRFFAHRVLACQGDRFLTQGDSLPQPDPAVAAVAVLGKLDCFHRGGRRRRSRRPGPQDRFLSWLFKRSDLATRSFLRWHRWTQRIRS